MKKLKEYKELLAGIAAFLFFAVVSQYFRASGELSPEFLQFKNIGGMAIYTLSGFVATVIAPLSTLPFVPVAVKLWGPFLTGILSIVGWIGGAMFAFFLARQFGNPLVKKFVALEKLERIERLIPEKNIFWSIVLLRLSIPGDILSYVLGLFSRVPFTTYTFATFVGLAPFAFVVSYLSTIPLIFQILAFAAGMTILFFGYRRIHQRYKASYVEAGFESKVNMG